MLDLEFFQHPRAATRLAAAGHLVLLDDKDRSMCNAPAGAGGSRMLGPAGQALQYFCATPGS